MKFRLHIAGLALVLALAVAAFAEVPTDDASSGTESMTLIQAIVLGVVEGVTEYLPVSSTGHLLLAQRVMGIEDSIASDAYAICIQFGAILAVLGIFWKHVKSMFLGIFGRNKDGLHLAITIVIAFLPAAIVGYLFLDQIQDKLFGMWQIVMAWFVGGVAILAVARSPRLKTDTIGRELNQLTYKQALIIGLIQCIAMWPGTSRSLVTILGGVLVGMNLASAVTFSFLLGAITLSAVAIYETVFKGTEMLSAYGAPSLIAGFIAATISAVAAVEWMIGYIHKKGIAIFGYYRIGLALLVALALLTLA